MDQGIADEDVRNPASPASVLLANELEAQAADPTTHQFSSAVRSRLAANLADPTQVEGSTLAANFVLFRNHDGTPVAPPQVVVITLTADGTGIDDIAIYASLAGVGH